MYVQGMYVDGKYCIDKIDNYVYPSEIIWKTNQAIIKPKSILLST